MVLICGIDEAGRGPIIGPFVMCGVVIKEEDNQKLLDIAVKDSKLLTAKQRDDLYKKILKIVKDYELIIIQPKEIDDAVDSEDGNNLNWMEAQTTAKILNKLNPEKAIIDCPSPNIPKYTEYIKKLLNNKDMILICAHHADRDFPTVSAASILAKVTRDREIELLKKKHNIEFGSGYIADPITKEFTENNWSKYPEIFRHSWAPYKKLQSGKNQKKLGEF